MDDEVDFNLNKIQKMISYLKFFAVIIFLFVSQIGIAQDGFISLFDGKTFEGWTINDDNPESFMIEDGMLKTVGGKSHIFYTGKVANAQFKNFELRMRVRTMPGANSGVYVQTQYQKNGWPRAGFECQVNSTHTDPKKTGSLYNIMNIWSPKEVEAPIRMYQKKNGEVNLYAQRAPSIDNEWFDYCIIVKDKTITIKVNGEIQVQWTQPDDWSKETKRIQSGTFAIQAHDPKSEVHYKDIKVKMLDQ